MKKTFAVTAVTNHTVCNHKLTYKEIQL